MEDMIKFKSAGERYLVDVLEMKDRCEKILEKLIEDLDTDDEDIIKALMKIYMKPVLDYEKEMNNK